MATAVQQQPYRGGSGYVARSSSSGLYDVLELILDKGLVIDVFVRVSLIGIEILTIDARIVIASVDTYLRFAEAVNRLDLMSTETQGLPELMEGITEGGASSKTKGCCREPKRPCSATKRRRKKTKGTRARNVPAGAAAPIRRRPNADAAARHRAPDRARAGGRKKAD